MLQKGSKVAVVSTGTIGTNVTKAFAQLENKTLFSHYHFPFIKPLDSANISQIIDAHEIIITLEEGVLKGGFGQQINTIVASQNKKLAIINLGIPDTFIEHGTVLEQQQFCNLDVSSLIFDWDCKVLIFVFYFQIFFRIFCFDFFCFFHV